MLIAYTTDPPCPIPIPRLFREGDRRDDRDDCHHHQHFYHAEGAGSSMGGRDLHAMPPSGVPARKLPRSLPRRQPAKRPFHPAQPGRCRGRAMAPGEPPLRFLKTTRLRRHFDPAPSHAGLPAISSSDCSSALWRLGGSRRPTSSVGRASLPGQWVFLYVRRAYAPYGRARTHGLQRLGGSLRCVS